MSRKPDRALLREVLGTINAPDVLRGLADYVQDPDRRYGPYDSRFDEPHDWVFHIAHCRVGARPMVVFAALHSHRAWPLSTLYLDGSTGELCRDRLVELGFRFDHELRSEAKQHPAANRRRMNRPDGQMIRSAW